MDTMDTMDKRWTQRTPVVVAECVIFAALISWAAITDRAPLWVLGLGTIGFAIAIAYTQGRRPFGRYTLAILVAWVLVLSLTSCSDARYTNAPGPGSAPPNLVGMRFTHQGEDMECGLGLTKNGISAVVTTFAPPIGFIAWAAWTVTDGDGLRATLQQCWQTSQSNWREIELMTQCWGQPVVKSTWTDWGAASQWVAMPFCTCNLTCQQESWLTSAGWAWFELQMRTICFLCSRATAATDTTDTTDTTLPPDQSLSDLGFVPPAWDPSTPAPPHPMGADGWPTGS